MEKLYTVSKNRTWSSDVQLLIAKFRLKLKKIGENTRPFRYDLNQIPYDYTVEVTNRFKGLDLVDRVPEELWTEVHNIVQEAITKTIPKKKKCRKAKWFSVFHGGSVVKNSPANAGDMNHSMPGLPVHHQLLEFIQIHVH